MDVNETGNSDISALASASQLPACLTARYEARPGQVTSAPAQDLFPGFPHQGYTGAELVAIQEQLASLLSSAPPFPLECSLGGCAFLFESGDDIPVVMDSLAGHIIGAGG